MNINIPTEELRSASNYTETCYRGAYIEIFYDRELNKIYCHYHDSENNWTKYDDPAVIRVAKTTRHMMQKQIAEAVQRAVAEQEEYEKVLATETAEGWT